MHPVDAMPSHVCNILQSMVIPISLFPSGFPTTTLSLVLLPPPPPHGCYMPTPSILLYFINKIIRPKEYKRIVTCTVQKLWRQEMMKKAFYLQHITSNNYDSGTDVWKRKELEKFEVVLATVLRTLPCCTYIRHAKKTSYQRKTEKLQIHLKRYSDTKRTGQIIWKDWKQTSFHNWC